MFCEICGERKATERVDMDGMQLAVCDGCTKFGRVQERPVKQDVRREAPREKEDVLPDYAERIRGAREERGLSIEELGKAILEKKSVLHKVEGGRMLPDDRLAKKLEKFLDIRLRGVVSGGPAKGGGKDLPEATLGDLAEVKVRK